MTLALAGLLVGGCNQTPNPHVEWPPDANWDAKQWPTECNAVSICGRLHDLGCGEGNPTSAGTPCTTWIVPYIDAGMVNGACICAADSVAAVRGCHVKCRTPGDPVTL